MGTTAQKLTYLNDTKSLLKDSINSLGGDITSQTTFRQYATELDSIYASLPKISGSGSNISLSPTRKGRITSVINGNTEQEATEGYQLLKLNDKEPSTPAGLTEYSIINKEITLKGTTNSNGNLTLYFDNLTLPAGDYTLVAYLTNTVPSNSSQVWLRKRNENITGLNLWGGLKRVKNFTLDEETTILGGANNSYLYVNGNMSFDTKIKLMILSGTYTEYNVPDWEEYTNGASPNPDYPQDIQSATGLQTIDITGKNIEDFFSIGYTEGNAATVSRNNGEYTVINTVSTYGSCQFKQSELQLKPNTTYAFSTKIVSTTNTQGSSVFVSSSMCNDNTQKWGTYATNGNISYVVFTTPSEIPSNALIGLYPRGENNTAVFTNIQLEKGSTSTTYEAYQSQIKELNLGNIKLKKSQDGTYSDYIQGLPNNWSIKRQIGSVVLDSTLNWQYTNGVFYRNSGIFPTSYLTGQSMICNYYQYGGSATNTSSAYANGNNMISSNANDGTSLYIRNDSITSVNDFKTHLLNNNVEVDYVLAEETTEAITNQEIINQLNEIYYLQSYNGTTNITITSDNLELIMTASALKGDE